MSYQIPQLQNLITEKTADILRTKTLLSEHTEHQEHLIRGLNCELIKLKMELEDIQEELAWDTQSRAPAAEANPLDVASPIEMEDEEDPCYHCGRYISSCICADYADQADKANDSESEEGWGGYARAPQSISNVFVPAPVPATAGECRLMSALSYPFTGERAERTKLTWVSDKNPETYRVAVAVKGGILQVKEVTDGGGRCHQDCTCTQCINWLSAHMKGSQRPRPLVKIFFKDEATWRASLPSGFISVSPPHISDKALKKLCCDPLQEVCDGLKLKELEGRFPGALFILSTGREQLELKHARASGKALVHCSKTLESYASFKDFYTTKNPKVQLMAEWRKMYIDLSHLF